MGGTNCLDFSEGDRIRLDFSVRMGMIWLFCGQSKLAWFLNAGRKSLVFSVSMKLNFKFACVVQIDLIPVKDEIDLVVWLVENGFISEWSIVFIYIYF